jgi:lysyl-tRNA synthetase class 2
VSQAPAAGGDWQPSASLAALRQWAELLSRVRAFFARRALLEVTTPLLCTTTATDPQLVSFVVTEGEPLPRFLQTSPELAMKRLLAAGSGPIYQIAKAFRQHERGARHNPEFHLLEWYRPGFSLERLMDEVAELVAELTGRHHFERLSYRTLFARHLDLDPFATPTEELERTARRQIDLGPTVAGDRQFWLDLLLTHLIEPRLASIPALFIHDYPPEQAALARLRRDECGVWVAARFELYLDGIEIANGYDELTDADEQRRRFIADNQRRQQQGQPQLPVDERLLAALAAGLPATAGVALGLERLAMAATGQRRIDEVLAFTFERA